MSGKSLAAPGLVPEDLMKFRWLQGIALAQAGDKVAYTVRRPEGNGYQVDLFLNDLASGQSSKLTSGTGQALSPAWSRDGTRLAYAWQQEGGVVVQITDFSGQAVGAYPIPGGVPQGLDWSPDGRRLAFSRWTAAGGGEAPDGAPQEVASVPPDGVPAPSVRVIRRLRYKQDGAGWVHDRYRHIWTLTLETGELEQLTEGECDYSQPRWSWSGRRIACVATAREQNRPMGYGQIAIWEAETGQVTPLMPDWPGAAVSPQWRRDDGAIVFAGHDHPPPVHRRIFYHVWLYELESQKARDLTASIDQTVGNYAISDQRAGLTNQSVRWPGGRGPIFFLLTDQGATHLYSVTESGPPKTLVGGQGVVFEYAPAGNGAVAYGRAHPASPGELYLWQEGQQRQLTELNPWLSGRVLARPEAYWYEGLDRSRVHAWELKPIGFQETQLYPAIIYVHCSMFSWDFYHEFQCLANAEYHVFYFNQRGTTAGYGQAHALGNYYGAQEAEFAEIMRGVDQLSQRPAIDSGRLGVTGGSCGGFLTNWIVGHTDRFAAAVTQRSVVDLVSKFGTSDNGPEQATSEGGGEPWNDVQKLWFSSPIAYAPEIKTPLLILHSEEDHRCALSQAEELFAALRWRGRKVELVIFEGESHGLANGGRPGNRIERLRRILDWFDRHMARK